jgi:quercetin dioxygenase-like cupin family protein
MAPKTITGRATRIGWLAAALAVSTVSAQSTLPPPFPRQNATQLLETPKAVVWDIVWPKGQPTAMHRHPHDQVGTYYARGGRVITQPDGSKRETTTEVGSLSTTRKGTTHIEEGATDPPLRAVFIELLQDKGPATSAPDTSALAQKAPRSTYDDDRVTVWDLKWESGPAALKYHASRDTVIVFLDAGKLRSAGGKTPSVTDVKAGTMRYLARDSEETLEVVEGAPRTMFFELK